MRIIDLFRPRRAGGPVSSGLTVSAAFSVTMKLLMRVTTPFSIASTPEIGHQQAGPPSAIDEAQPQSRAAFPFAGGDAAAAGGFSDGNGGDGQPEPIL